MSDWILCVDFGTAFSKAAAAPRDAWSAFDPKQVRPLAIAGQTGRNAFLLDSAVFVDDTRVLFGAAALERANVLSDRKRIALRSFKTLLSTSDLERALNTMAAAAIDPQRVFTMRDLLVLYLAYLNAAVDRAIAADPMLAGASLERRYAAPAWRRGDSAGLHNEVLRLFGEADALRATLDVSTPDGVSIDDAKRAIANSRLGARPAKMGLIFEATAAAAYTSIGLKVEAPAMIVLDMGAGTTDIAVLARAGARVEELREAQVTINQAGDYIDRVIANLALDAARLKATDKQSDLWWAMMREMRDFKDSLFAEGRAVLRHNGKTIKITMKDVQRAEDFRAFEGDLLEAYEGALETARRYAVTDGSRAIQSVAVGGGAAAPFIQAIIRTAPRGGGRVKVMPKPATPEWAHAPEFRGNLAPVFPQLAIAIGGALAPDDMLAARA
ncbi:MAG: rod shape-determining protein [Terricaulis sp.]